MQGKISEFNGEDGRSGLPKFKSPRAMTAGEKLSLMYRTGTQDPDAPPDDGATFRGEMPSET